MLIIIEVYYSEFLMEYVAYFSGFSEMLAKLQKYLTKLFDIELINVSNFAHFTHIILNFIGYKIWAKFLYSIRNIRIFVHFKFSSSFFLR